MSVPHSQSSREVPPALDRFAPATREWFSQAFAAPTPAQVGAWEGFEAGDHTLVVAPTGSDKTLAAFLSSIDRLLHEPPPVPTDRKLGTRVLYVSPLKALAVDVERNLRSPLVGITQAAARRGETFHDVTVGVRSGDTPQQERRRLISHPPDILITTPESLFLMLTSAARESLLDVDTVIVDEIHAVAGTKRGAHLCHSNGSTTCSSSRPAGSGSAPRCGRTTRSPGSSVAAHPCASWRRRASHCSPSTSPCRSTT